MATSKNSLSTDDHFEVCQSLKRLNDKELIQLGTALGLFYSELKKMKDLPGEMVDAWLKGMDNVLKKSGPPSWTSLIKALESIDQEGVASATRKDAEMMASKKPAELDKAPFPFLSKDMAEHVRTNRLHSLMSNTTKIKHSFIALEFHLQEALKKSGITAEKIIQVLSRGDPGSHEAFKECDSIDKVFNEGEKHWSFFDYALIELLISCLLKEEHELNSRLKTYKTEFKDYARHRVCECPSNVFGDEEENEKPLVFKIEKYNFETMTLNELEELCFKLNSAIGSYHLRLLKTDQGCVQLTFRALPSADEMIQKLTREEQQALRNVGVLSITYGEQTLNLGSGKIAEHEDDEEAAKNSESDPPSLPTLKGGDDDADSAISDITGTSVATRSTYGGSIVTSGLGTDISDESKVPSTTKVNKFPYLKVEGLTDEQQEDLKEQLEYDAREILRKFSILVDKTRESLQISKITVDLLISSLNNFHAKTIAEKLEKESDGDLLKAFEIMSKYWSFFDYEILSIFIEGHCEEDVRLQEYFSDYKSKFETYHRKHKLCEIPIDSFGDKSQDKHKYVHIKMDDKFKSITEFDIVKQNKRLSYILGTIICLKEFKEDGCIELAYIVADENFLLCRQQKKKLSEIGVVKMYSDTEVYFENYTVKNLEEDLINAGVPRIPLSERFESRSPEHQSVLIAAGSVIPIVKEFSEWLIGTIKEIEEEWLKSVSKEADDVRKEIKEIKFHQRKFDQWAEKIHELEKDDSQFRAHIDKTFNEGEEIFENFEKACKKAEENCNKGAKECEINASKAGKKDFHLKAVGVSAIAVGAGVLFTALVGAFTFGVGAIPAGALAIAGTGGAVTGGVLFSVQYYKNLQKKYEELGQKFEEMHNKVESMHANMRDIMDKVRATHT